MRALVSALLAIACTSEQVVGSEATRDSAPTEVDGRGDAAAIRPGLIAAADGATCAANDDELWCWGAAWAAGGTASSRPRTRGRFARITQLAGNGQTMCFVHDGGVLRCFGRTSWAADALLDIEPRIVLTNASISSVAVSAQGVAAVTRAGHLYLWGANTFNEALTAKSREVVAEPRIVDVGLPMTSVAAGAGHYCGKWVDGSLRCWGDNQYAQSYGSLPMDWVLPDLVKLRDASTVAPNARHTCALERGTTYCWGENFSGQLGTRTLALDLLTIERPFVAAIVSPAIDLGSSRDTTYAVLEDRAVARWGGGQPTPSRIAGLPPIAEITRSVAEHACARAMDQTVWCWGSNKSGELGRGTMSAAELPARVVF
jgi:hypothetical protein